MEEPLYRYLKLRATDRGQGSALHRTRRYPTADGQASSTSDSTTPLTHSSGGGAIGSSGSIQSAALRVLMMGSK